ncbi:hypothetical protein Tco_0729082 [Tanacetum coccineum]|uniref:Uncharacterized protein n=1 Tax=Tanacetum coccineum TaxID=301880 RepID=A0ABQ4YQA5_9ASTR
MLWGIITKAIVDYVELLWEEFVQGIQTLFSHHANLNLTTKKSTPLIIPNYRSSLKVKRMKFLECYSNRVDNRSYSTVTILSAILGNGCSEELKQVDDEEVQPAPEPLVDDYNLQRGPEPQFMAPVHISSGPNLSLMMPGQNRFQVLFQVKSHVTKANEPVPTATAIHAQAVLISASIFTTIAQDAPSTSMSPSSSDIQALVLYQGIAARPNVKDDPFVHAVPHPSFNPITGEPNSVESSLGDVRSAEPNQVTQQLDHLRKWTKDHPC